MPPLSNLY